MRDASIRKVAQGSKGGREVGGRKRDEGGGGVVARVYQKKWRPEKMLNAAAIGNKSGSSSNRKALLGYTRGGDLIKSRINGTALT